MLLKHACERLCFDWSKLAGRHRRDDRAERRWMVLRAHDGRQIEIQRPIAPGGTNRSMQSLKANPSPSSAMSIALRVSLSPSPSSIASAASVALWRAPFGLPGLPGPNGLPRVFGAFLRGVVIVSPIFSYVTVPIAPVPVVAERDDILAKAVSALRRPFERRVRLAPTFEPVATAAAEIVDHQNRVRDAS